jgi:hypothetical protein
VVDYTDSYDPALPKAEPTVADRLEHARIQGGLNPSRLGTILASERKAQVPVSYVPLTLETRASNNRNLSSMPVLPDKMPFIPRFKKDVGIYVGPVQWTWWSGKDTLAAQGGWDQSGIFRYGKQSTVVKALSRSRDSSVAAAESRAKNFAAEVNRFIGAAVKGGTMTEEQAATVLNDALGSTRNWTDPVVAKQLDTDRKAANKVAQGTFLGAFHQVTALRATDPAGADALHQQMVDTMRTSIEQNRLDMEVALQSNRDLRFRQTKNRQTDAHRDILATDPEFHAKLVDFRRLITAEGNKIAAAEVAAAQALQGRVPDVTYQAAMSSALDLKATVDRERGLWLHRTYSLHRDPKWYDRLQATMKNGKFPDLLPVIAEAEAFVRSELVDTNTKRLRYENMIERQSDPTVPILKEPDARVQADAYVTMYPGLIDAGINELLDYGRAKEGSYGSSSTSTAVPAVLRNRKDIPDPIRALWGEVKNPRVNAAQALIATTQRNANKQFLKDLVELGVYDPANPDKPFFLVTKGQVGTLPNTAAWEPVISLNDRNEASPLAGLYGPAAIHEAMRDMFDPVQQHAIMQWLNHATGYALSTKTIQSPKSQFRNLISNVLISAANGNAYNPAKTKYALGAIKLVALDVTNRGGIQTRALIAELIRRKVIHDSNSAGLMIDLMRDMSDDLDLSQAHLLVRRAVDRRVAAIKGLPGNYMDVASSIYQAGDDVFKIFNYYGEMHSLNYIYEKERTAAASDPTALAALEEKIKTEAAALVTKTNPTYSFTPELIRMFRKSPANLLGAPFVNWTAEVIRTTYNIFHQGFSDLGSDNSRRQARGAERVVAASAAMSAVWWLSAGFLALAKAAAYGLAGAGDEEERKRLPDWMRNLNAAQPTAAEEAAFRANSLPPWSQSSSIMFLGKDEQDNWRYWDLSFTDPYDYWKRVARSAKLAVQSNNSSGMEAAMDGLIAATKEALDPFTGEQLLFGAVREAVMGEAPGQNKNAPLVRTGQIGDEITDFARGLVTGTRANDSGNLVNGMLHVVNSTLVPGFVDSAQGLAKGVFGTVEGAKVYDTSDEVMNFFGLKINKVNNLEAASFKLRDQRIAYDEAASRVRDKTFTDRGTAGGENLNDALDETARRQIVALGEARKTLLRLDVLGVPRSESLTQLKELGFRIAAIDQIANNYYLPTMPSNETIVRAAKSPGAKGQDRIPTVIKSTAKAYESSATKRIPLLPE